MPGGKCKISDVDWTWDRRETPDSTVLDVESIKKYFKRVQNMKLFDG